jgi:hypothetical protein
MEFVMLKCPCQKPLSGHLNSLTYRLMWWPKLLRGTMKPENSSPSSLIYSILFSNNHILCPEQKLVFDFTNMKYYKGSYIQFQFSNNTEQKHF